MLVIENTTELGEAASKVMNSSPQIENWKQLGWNYLMWSPNERAKIRSSQSPADDQDTSPGMSTIQGTLLVMCQGGVGIIFLMERLYCTQNDTTLQIRQRASWSCQNEGVFS